MTTRTSEAQDEFDGFFDVYADDTFFHLSLVGQVGLVLISLLLAAITLAGTWALTRRRGLVTRVLASLGVVVVFEWLAPQIHYLWYLVVIDGLPLQWVVPLYPQPAAAWQVLGFQLPESLSAHSRAALGWLVIATALAAPWIRQPRSRH